MTRPGTPPFFIGCATSREFMVLTTALISSLDEFGDVADATVIVGDFGLTDQDREWMRASAGRLGRALRFIRVEPDSPLIVAKLSYPFPLPSLGRLVIPSQLGAEGRLVWLDSDMLINHSLRPLLEMDLEGKPLAAVLDPLSEPELRARGRELNPDYFNAGLMVMDLERFNGNQVGQAAVRRLAEFSSAPTFLDQDGINDVVGPNWVRLERKWNLFYAGDSRQFTFEEFSAAPIVHFAGAKPTEAPDHPAHPLWARQVERIAEKVAARNGMNGCRTPSLAAQAQELLLGRELAELPDTSRSPAEALGDIIASNAFKQDVLNPLARGTRLSRPTRGPSTGQRLWAAERLPLRREAAERVETATEWWAFFSHLVEDPHFMALAGLAPQPVGTDPGHRPAARGFLRRIGLG